MKTTKYILGPPSLEELAKVLAPTLESHYKEASISVSRCPDLRQAPFHLACEGLSSPMVGGERIADVGGQSNLFPEPRLDKKYSLASIANAMEMSPDRGFLIGAGAGPFHAIGVNSELAPNLGWEASFDNVTDRTYYTKVVPSTNGDKKSTMLCARSPCTDCALMANLYGSKGLPGQVLKISARGRKGTQASFANLIRSALQAHYGDRAISLGGVFVIKSGTAHFHVMPDFPSQPFPSRENLEKEWLTYYDFQAPIVCLSVLHSADPGAGLRMEHTHAFSVDGSGRGGHYHYDVLPGEDKGEEVEYEAYFNTAKLLYRIDRPEDT